MIEIVSLFIELDRKGFSLISLEKTVLSLKIKK